MMLKTVRHRVNKYISLDIFFVNVLYEMTIDFCKEGKTNQQ